MAIFVDDRELLAAHLAGDSNAFDEIVREHRPALYRHAVRRLSCESSAEDAVQETLVRAYKALPNFSGEYRLGPWLHRILQNVCVDEGNRRKKDFDKVRRVSALSREQMDSPSIEEELHLDFDDSDLQEALKNLSEPYREALSMRYLDGLDYSQVSQAAGVSEQNARARVSRAKVAVRIALKSCAVLPVFLWGLLKRGEKFAAAATTASNPIALSSPKSSIGLMAQAVPQASSILPVINETAVTITPIFLPIVAKAAVGVGIVAAIMSPAPDSVIHQAVEEIRSSSGQISYAFEQPMTDETNNRVVLTAPKTQNEQTAQQTLNLAGENNTVENRPSDSYETLSPSYVISDDEIDMDSDFAAGTRTEINQISVPDQVVKGIGGRMSSPKLNVEMLRSGNYNLLGFTQLELGNSVWTGFLSDASYIKLYMDPDRDGRDRFDGLIELMVSESVVIEIRLAGFATSVDGALMLDGVYRSLSNTDLSSRGVVSGSLATEIDSGFGSLEIDLSS